MLVHVTLNFGLKSVRWLLKTEILNNTKFGVDLYTSSISGKNRYENEIFFF